MEEKDNKMAFTKQNYQLLLISIAVVIIGLLLMIGGKADSPSTFNEEALYSFRRITLSPIIIVVGFGLGVYAILKRPNEVKKEN